MIYKLITNLKNTVLEYTDKHTEEMFKTKEFHEISEEAFGTLLASNNLNTDKIDLNYWLLIYIYIYI